MPELTPQSSSLPPPAVPRSIDPAAWEDFAVFRESFLMYLTPPALNEAMREVADSFFTLLLEHSGQDWPGWPESTTRTEMRAALADLRHLVGFLASIGQERRVASLSPGDAKLSLYASGIARVLNRIGNGIERKLARDVPS